MQPRIRSRPLSLAQRWLLWMVMQGLLALSLAAGPAAISGPLHWHEGGGAHQHLGAERHHHEPATEALLLEPSAPAADELSSANANAAAWLAPALAAPLAMRHPDTAQGFARAPAARWTDAEPSRPEHRPRQAD